MIVWINVLLICESGLQAHCVPKGVLMRVGPYISGACALSVAWEWLCPIPCGGLGIIPRKFFKTETSACASYVVHDAIFSTTDFMFAAV